MKSSRKQSKRRGLFSFLRRTSIFDSEGYGNRRLQIEPLEGRQLLSINPGLEAIDVFSTSSALFAENNGQWVESVHFGYNDSGTQIYFTDDSLEFGLTQKVNTDGFDEEAIDPIMLNRQEDAYEYSGTHFSLSFNGATPTVPIGVDLAATKFNYHIGEQANWIDGASTYNTVIYDDLYDGIDLHTYGKQGQMKYEFHMEPGSDYSQISLSYEGIIGLSVAEDGSLHVATELGELIDEDLYIYQIVDGQEVKIAGDFVLIDNNTYSFNITGTYDPSFEIVIDPVFEWGSFLGGSNYDMSNSVAMDSEGNIYVCGETQSSNWDVSGGWDTTYGGSGNGYVVKLSNTGEHVWSTYLGGSNWGYALGIATDAQDNIYVVGDAQSDDWGISGGWDTTFGGSRDAYLVKLDSNGGHIWSTFMGGSSREWARSVAVDSEGYIYVCGNTESDNFGISGGWDTTFGGNGRDDGFIFKFSDRGEHIWSTYLGGIMDTWVIDITTDLHDDVYVCGWTESNDWGVSGGWDTTFSGPYDGHVVKLSSSGNHLWSTYLGKSGYDNAYGITTDSQNNVYVVGGCESIEGVAGGWDPTYSGGYDGYVVKLTESGSHLWSSYLGGTGYDDSNGVFTDAQDNVYICGGTTSSDWEISGGVDVTFGGSYDGYAIKLSDTGEHIWSSYLGGSGTDESFGIITDDQYNVYICGYGGSTDWDIANGWDTNYAGGRDGCVVKISQDVNNSTLRLEEVHGDIIDESGIAHVTGNIIGSDYGPFSLTIDWGEGFPITYEYPAGTTSFDESHQYFDDNPSGTMSDNYEIYLTLTDNSPSNEWIIDGQLPTNLCYFGMEPIDDELFIFGGQTSPHNDTASSWLYTPGTGVVEARASMPTRIHAMGTAESNGQILSVGGYLEGTGVWGRRKEVWSYDPITDNWHDETPLPFERDVVGATSLDGYVYSIGGHSETSLHALANNDRYDPAVNGPWEAMAPMSQERRCPGVATVDGKIYVMGGTYHPSSGPSNYMNIGGWLEIYDPVTNTWTEGPSMPTPRTQFATAVVGSRIYAIGGTGVVDGTECLLVTFEELYVSDTVEYYDTETGTWHEDTSLPIPLYSARAAAVEDKLYVAGGGDGIINGQFKSDVYVLDLSEKYSTTVTVNNVAPEIDFGEITLDVLEGGTATVSGTFTDPALGVPTEIFTGNAIWSDGTSTPVVISGNSFTTSRDFDDDNPTGTPSDIFTVDITITDDDGGSDTKTSPEITIHNVSPVINNISDPIAIAEGDTVIVEGTFSDPALGVPTETFIGTATWSDGVVTPVVIVGDTFSTCRMFDDDNPSGTPSDDFAVEISITDDDNQPDGQKVLGEWLFNSGEGVTAHDSSGNDLHGMLNQADGFWVSPGRDGTGACLNYLGYQNIRQVEVPDSPILDLGSLPVGTEVMLEAWVKPENSGNELLPVLSKGSSVVSYGFGVWGNRVYFQANYRNTSQGADLTAFGDLAVPYGQWSHIAASYDGETVRLFVNGKLDETISFANGLVDNDQSLLIGYDPAGVAERYQGMIDDVRISYVVDSIISTTVTVNNVDPTLDINNVTSNVLEGEIAIVSGTFTDPALGVDTETFTGCPY